MGLGSRCRSVPVHALQARGEGADGGLQCVPRLLPPEILSNAVDHRRPFPGDQGVASQLERSTTFEPHPGIAREALAVLYRHLDAL